MCTSSCPLAEVLKIFLAQFNAISSPIIQTTLTSRIEAGRNFEPCSERAMFSDEPEALVATLNRGASAIDRKAQCQNNQMLRTATTSPMVPTATLIAKQIHS